MTPRVVGYDRDMRQPASDSIDALKPTLAFLAKGGTLNEHQAASAFESIMSGSATAAQVGALLGMIQFRGPTAQELVGAARVMRGKATPVRVPPGLTIIDTCGTGGDHSNTFNISTAGAIVTAGASRRHNVAVAKHGNRSVTSTSGSSQVLETLGVKLMVEPQTLTRCLDEAGLCFCFAPAHHPAMKHVGAIRQDLGFRTIFNLLGPLTNPAGAQRQLIGVFTADLTELYAQVLQALGSTLALVVHGQIAAGSHPTGTSRASGRAASGATSGAASGASAASGAASGGSGGVDELTTLGPCKMTWLADGQIRTDWLDPVSLGLHRAQLEALRVSGPQASAKVIEAVLEGQQGPARDTVCLNAAAALVVGGVASGLAQGLDLARQSIDQGHARRALKMLINITQADPSG